MLPCVHNLLISNSTNRNEKHALNIDDEKAQYGISEDWLKRS